MRVQWFLIKKLAIKYYSCKRPGAFIEIIIKQIHYLVLADKREDRGIYRRVPVKIMGAKHEPVQPYWIRGDSSFYWRKWQNRKAACKSGIDESSISAIAIKSADHISYYKAFDECLVKHNPGAMEKLPAGYVNARLNSYLDILRYRKYPKK